MSAIQLLESLSKDPVFKNNLMNTDIEALLSSESLQGIEDLKDKESTMWCLVAPAEPDQDDDDQTDDEPVKDDIKH